MAQVTKQTNTFRLSEIATDPVLQAFFARGERDSGDTFAVPVNPRRPVSGAEVKAEEYAHA